MMRTDIGIPRAYEGSLCTRRDHVVRGGVQPADTRKYCCDCGLVLVDGTGKVEIRFGLLAHRYPEPNE